ncbi:MAG: hypothetical protein ACRBCI_14755 [Cellvibrionaceae bacterium]
MNTCLRYASLVAICVGFSASVDAYCTRNDIDHYLDKGFSPEQITALCTQTVPGNSPTAAPTSTNSLDKDTQSPVAPTSASAVTSEQQRARDFMFSTIDADDVRFEEDRLLFQRTVCTEYGNKSSSGKRYEACVDTSFNVQLSNLDIVEYKSRNVIFGKNKIVVKGSIKRDFINYDELDSRDKVFVDRTYRDQPVADIPIRNGVDMKRAVRELKKLIGATSENKG